MMRLQAYAGISLIATLAVVCYAFMSRGQFYPAMVYLSTSRISLGLLFNMRMVIMLILWQLTKRIFLGSLREAEVERLNEQSWLEVMEILFAITVFRQDFSVSLLAMVTALLLIKALHWLAQKRVEYIETTPTVPGLCHVRIVSFMGFLLVIDGLLLFNYVDYLVKTRQASVSIFFSFQYMILATTALSTFLKYVFYVSDMLMEGQWERKAVYTFYLELIRDLLHLSMYLCFFLVIFMNYGIPLHLIHELYETFRNFKIRIADYIRYRKITSNMNDSFPDATSNELNTSDATCIICREEMTTAKKLTCGHLFHVHCLRSWLERQHTCPTCRALVVPHEDVIRTAGSQTNVQQGTNIESASQGSQADCIGFDSVNQHRARIQAAATAASVYEKSFVYPSEGMQLRLSGPIHNPLDSSVSVNSGQDQSQLNQFMAKNGSQFPCYAFAPSQRRSSNLHRVENSDNYNWDSQLDAHKKLLEQHIEILQHHLMLLKKINTERAVDNPGASSGKAKAV
ncbi:ERAD-associated E3 ubiquitin-protein ligase HRD1B-like [Ipomoea triloba]|uniref:ERAD-associated E3 ubiquitin-protein ligase HRD1B-like n=1 Tax=Ipomoea triloba TaxID=35885 RepID=UPI00125E3A5B|nr:ERAD-associated E3 ubiquitin-protein ligase HRD1B-like [Ipomoea triloba]XP_031115298.1 ERAD-associated E3 ubiquitin-protein ligase HRD1B-like [Ipomoea triloba]